MKKIMAVLLAVMMLAAVAVGCANNSGQTGSTGTTGGKTAAPARTDVKIALGGEVLALSIFNSNVTQDTMNAKLIYDSLVENDKDGNVVACLAKSWDISADGMVYTFHLQQGVKFHNGAEMTSADVAFSINRGIASPYLAANMGKYCDRAEAVDKYTVKMYMKQPYTAILSMMVQNFCVENEAYFKTFTKESDYIMKPMGTGPYKYVSYQPGVGLELEAFADYWRGAPAIKKMSEKIITDVNAVATALETGDIDFAGVSSTVSNSTIPEFQANKNLEVHNIAGTMLWFFAINCELKGYDNVKVRQAMAYALDKDYLMKVQAEGYGQVANSINSPSTFGFYDQPKFEYNVEKAKALLAEAGYKDGVGLPALQAVIRQDRQKGTEVFQQSLKEIGIKLEINVQENTTYLSTCRQGNFGTSLIAATMPPDAALFDKFWLAAGIGADNYARLNAPELDQLLNQAATNTDKAKRVDLYKQAYTIANNLCAYIPCFYADNIVVANKNLNVGNRYPDAPFLRFEEMSWKS